MCHFNWVDSINIRLCRLIDQAKNKKLIRPLIVALN